jgi:hypothetical protein
MGIFKRFKEWRTKRWLNKLEGGLNMLRNRINFDPKYVFKIDEMDTSEAYTRKLIEYKVWFSGNSRALRQLYNESIKEGSLNYFWYKAPNNYRMLHSGIPGLISSKMPTILFGGGYKVNITVYGKDGEISEEQSSKAQELCDNILKIIDFNERIENAAENESPFGHIFFKLSFDTNLTDYPILEIADPTKAEAIKERGITSDTVFKYWYKLENDEYRLDEVYTANDDGDSIIRYELYKMNSDGSAVRVDLDKIPQTHTHHFHLVYMFL